MKQVEEKNNNLPCKYSSMPEAGIGGKWCCRPKSYTEADVWVDENLIAQNSTIKALLR
jgi:hypothetical protein